MLRGGAALVRGAHSFLKWLYPGSSVGCEKHSVLMMVGAPCYQSKSPGFGGNLCTNTWASFEICGYTLPMSVHNLIRMIISDEKVYFSCTFSSLQCVIVPFLINELNS